MALGRRKSHQQEMFIPTSALPRSPGHPFYEALNEVLKEAKFDSYVEELCEPLYKEGGRPSIPPGVFFRMLFIGYFEGIDSQRGIAWRCSDSLSLRSFLGLPATTATPDHSSLTVIRKRLPKELIEQVFAFVLGIAVAKKLVKGTQVGVDATTLEANAAMKSIVRQDTGDNWKEYLTKLAKAEGIENPTDDELRRVDRKRKGKKVSNDDWKSPTDPDARITKMKDGTTHLAYKAEHAVDMDNEVVLAANVLSATTPDSESIKNTIVEAQGNLIAAVGEASAIEELAADKGYHKNETLAWLADKGIRSYVPERKDKKQRRWTDKPEEWRSAVYENRRRCRRSKGKRLQRRRSEVVERSFAHVCETGAARRSWIRGLTEVHKRYLVQIIAHNLAVVLRSMVGVGKPKQWIGLFGALMALVLQVIDVAARFVTHRPIGAPLRTPSPYQKHGAIEGFKWWPVARSIASSTGC